MLSYSNEKNIFVYSSFFKDLAADERWVKNFSKIIKV